ncbi:hypothetical protein PR202_gb04896 [Eleusine coracana subsp. coracana]|uniref:Uncharacterized protein n=1 Tax=Eleusine coracana subsp. coracana TaxID=191504 RepID=A0AAV5E5Q2_ELECO|nr:hypothetical protein PR202_gb04896 [Eleusine coracana subsp. coracana]
MKNSKKQTSFGQMQHKAGWSYPSCTTTPTPTPTTTNVTFSPASTGRCSCRSGRKFLPQIDIPGRKGAKGAKAEPGFSNLGTSRTSSGGGSVMIGSHVFVPPHVIVDRRVKTEKAMMMFVVPSRKPKKIREQLY